MWKFIQFISAIAVYFFQPQTQYQVKADNGLRDKPQIIGQTIRSDGGTLSLSYYTPLGDIDCSGKINGVDFAFLVAHWGTADPEANLDDLGMVDAADALILLANY